MNDLMILKEVAKYFRVSVQTIKRWDKSGKLISMRINDRGDRRYKREDIEKFKI